MTARHSSEQSAGTFVSPTISGACWYAVHTCSRHEKQVARLLQMRGVEHYLPTYTSLRRWKDRRTSIALPLFPGYLFVHMVGCGRLRVLSVPGVVSLVGNAGGMAVQDQEIEAIRRAASLGTSLQPHPYLRTGRRVRVLRGPLSGAEGIIVRRNGRHRIVISIDIIARSVAAEVDVCDLEPVSIS